MRVGPSPWHVAGVAALLLIQSVAAVFKDQAGQNEWRREQIGVPSHVSFRRSGKSSGARLALGSVEADTVSVLNAATGATAWRQQLASNDALLLVAVGGTGDTEEVLSLSFHDASDTFRVRVWDPVSGFLRTDFAVGQCDDEEATHCAATASARALWVATSDYALLLPGGIVARVDTNNVDEKHVRWSLNLDPTASYSELALAPSGDTLYILGRDTTSDKAVLVALAWSDGSPVSRAAVPQPQLDFDDDATDCFSARPAKSNLAFVCNAVDGDANVALFVPASDAPVVWIDGKNILGESTDPRSLRALELSETSPFFILTTGQTSSLVRIALNSETSFPELASVHRFSDIRKSEHAVFGTTAGDSTATRYVVRLAHGKKNGKLELVDAETGKLVKTWTVPVNVEETGDFVSVHLDAVVKNNVPTIRVLGITEDGTISLLQQGDVDTSMDIKWSRDESLAHIVDIEFFELPDAHLFSLDHDELDEPLAQTEKLNPLARYTRRWNTHLTHLQSYLPTLPARLASRVLGFLNPSSTPVANAANASIPLHTDRWGYRKLFVAGTRSGKVHAIETASGTTVWTRFLPRGSLVRDVEVVRAGAVKFPPVVGLFGQDAVTGSHFVHRLNALTGRDFEGEGAGLGAVERWEDGEHLIQLPVREGRESLRVFAVVTSKSTIELVPNTDEARAAFESILDHFFFYRVKHGDRGVVGYMGLKDEAKGVYLARKVWKLDLPEGEVVADFAERDRTEPISSMGKILGNRSVLYKYLNPNLLALATLRETTTTSTVYLYLLDTVTGTLLHRAEYLGAGNAGEGLHSIHLVQLDNAVVLSFYNHGPAATEAGAAAAAAAAAAVEGAAFVDEEANVAGAEPGAGKRRRNKKKAAALAGVKTAPNVKGYEVVVLETYEMPKPDLRVESDTYSSFNMKKPSILSQSYMFPNQITAMGFTRTGAGIASREILVGLSSNQVYGINKRLLDPRRPLGAPSADDREEQLFPYAPVLHFNPYDVASHELPVLGVTRIQSTGTLLESTSIVAAYGLDLFVARRAPSRTFDVLSEDFGYGWLILTMVSLVVGIQVAKYYAERKRLRDQWK